MSNSALWEKFNFHFKKFSFCKEHWALAYNYMEHWALAYNYMKF